MAAGDSSKDPDYLAREARARAEIDRQLTAAGWVVQKQDELNLYAGRGIALREVTLRKPHGRVDYLLFIDRRPIGVIEAKPEGKTLTEVEHQSKKYVTGLPDGMAPAPIDPLPFVYESTGTETRFTNRYDPDARSRRVFTFHRPETLAEWAQQIVDNPQTPTFRARLRAMPPVDTRGLWAKQALAIGNVEKSLAQDRPRALIQMATGSGKTFTAVALSYRLVRYADAKRILFLVDRKNLGTQAKLEFDRFTINETQRKFSAEYNIQHLGANTVGATSRVVISTVQRIFSLLKDGAGPTQELDERSAFELEDGPQATVTYSAALPPDAFDVIIIDECHRSIFGQWRQVLEYFDAHLIGLTATPNQQAFGFFRRNLVMEYSHEMAVADGVNVDFTVYKIETEITKAGSVIETGQYAAFRDRQTRAVRWATVDNPVSYTGGDLDRAIVAEDQIRTVIQTFHDKLFTELFPGRKTVPKTLIFAKTDAHADDIVQVVREVFGKGNDFAAKITYLSGGRKAEDLLQSFRNSVHPRIVVTVDMIATGTDIKPLECLLFMRSVKSRTYFEQMVGRGVRVINDTEFQSVTGDATHKSGFVIVDAVGVMESPLADNVQSLDRRPPLGLTDLLSRVALGTWNPEIASTLLGRLAKLDGLLTPEERVELTRKGHQADLRTIIRGLGLALDPDRQRDQARAEGKDENDPAAVAETAAAMLDAALFPLASNPDLRNALINFRRPYEQTIDVTSEDEVIFADHSPEARDKASATLARWRAYILENKDTIRALEILYSRPHTERLKFRDIKDLAATIALPPRRWTLDILWNAHELVEQDKVRGSGARTLTDIVALVRYSLHLDGELVPYRDQVEERFTSWLATQRQAGATFTPEQVQWLTLMKDNIAAELTITRESFYYTPFTERGGIGKAAEVFGNQLVPLMEELTEALTA